MGVVPAPEWARPPQRRRWAGRTRVRRPLGLALLIVVVFTLLGWAVPHWEPHLPRIGLAYDTSTAQAALGAIGGAMITLSGFVITAITVVVQTVQSTCPRLVGALHHMGRYVSVFGMLIGTALYALTALSQISAHQVPRATVTLAVLLVLADTVAVLYLIGSLRQAVTGGGLARAVGNRLRHVIAATFPTPHTEQRPPPLPPADDPPAHLTDIPRHGRPAVIQGYAERRMVRLAERTDTRIEILREVGDFVGAGSQIGRIRHPPGRPPTPRRSRRLAACVTYGTNRTVDQDAAYGLRLLADIAIRALSPGINDPTTAVQTLDQIEDCLIRLADRALGPWALLDRHGRVRVTSPAPRWPDYVSLALDETFLYGAGNLQVARRLRLLLDRVEAAAPEHRRAPLAEHRALLDRLVRAALPDPGLLDIATATDPQGLGGHG